MLQSIPRNRACIKFDSHLYLVLPLATEQVLPQEVELISCAYASSDGNLDAKLSKSHTQESYLQLQAPKVT